MIRAWLKKLALKKLAKKRVAARAAARLAASVKAVAWERLRIWSERRAADQAAAVEAAEDGVGSKRPGNGDRDRSSEAIHRRQAARSARRKAK